MTRVTYIVGLPLLLPCCRSGYCWVSAFGRITGAAALPLRYYSSSNGCHNQ